MFAAIHKNTKHKERSLPEVGPQKTKIRIMLVTRGSICLVKSQQLATNITQQLSQMLKQPIC